jgi:heme-degrading monooxygenase HmoA
MGPGRLIRAAEPMAAWCRDESVITQRMVVNVAPGREDEFEGALSEARQHVFEAEGFRRFSVERGLDRRSTYLVQILWETAEEQVRFTRSDLFTRWATLLDPFVVGTPVVERFEQRPGLSL